MYGIADEVPVFPTFVDQRLSQRGDDTNLSVNVLGTHAAGSETSSRSDSLLPRPTHGEIGMGIEALPGCLGLWRSVGGALVRCDPDRQTGLSYWVPAFSPTEVHDPQLPRLLDVWYRIFTDLGKIPGEQLLVGCRVEHVVLPRRVAEGHDAVAFSPGQGNVEQTGSLLAFGFGAPAHCVGPTQPLFQRFEAFEYPRQQPQRPIRKRMASVEDRSFLHRDLSVAVVLVCGNSDDDDRPLQALRLVHRRHQHGVMSPRLFKGRRCLG